MIKIKIGADISNAMTDLDAVLQKLDAIEKKIDGINAKSATVTGGFIVHGKDLAIALNTSDDTTRTSC